MLVPKFWTGCPRFEITGWRDVDPASVTQRPRKTPHTDFRGDLKIRSSWF